MFIFYRRYYLTITPWPIERMQLLTCGLAGFYGRPDNNRRAKVQLFLFMTNVYLLFFHFTRFFFVFHGVFRGKYPFAKYYYITLPSIT